jgi:glycosyltransferase involved in cell wall biosynthesis
MRLLHVIATLDPASGGPAAAVRSLIDFSPAEIHHEVVTLDDPAASFLAHLPFPVHALGPTRTKYGLNTRLIPWLTANRSRFDGVLVNGLWQFCGLAVWRSLRGLTPYMVFPHGMLDPYFRRAFPLKHLKKWIYWLAAEYWILRAADRVLFTTAREARLARTSFYPARWSAQVVPYGASPPPGDPEIYRRAWTAAFPQLRAVRFLLFLGRIHRKKGCDLLIDAFLEAAPLDPALHLVVAGPTSPDAQRWRATLEHRVAQASLASRVHWTGPLYGDAKWGALHNCEAFVLPSHQENFGIAVAEALACGKPVLLSDQVNIAPEIVRVGGGRMAPDTLAGTLDLFKYWISLSPESRLSMGLRAQRIFLTHFDIRVNAAAILDPFQQPEAISVSDDTLAPTPASALEQA